MLRRRLASARSPCQARHRLRLPGQRLQQLTVLGIDRMWCWSRCLVQMPGQYDFGPSRDFRLACPLVAEGKTGPTAAGVSGRFSEPCSFARRMQDIESDTVYDTRRRSPEGAIARACPTRPFATHADRLRSRLESRRLPVAGPAARRAAGRGRRRRPRLPRLRVRRPRRPTGTRQLRARAPDGRRARRLEARLSRPHPRPPGQRSAGPVGPRRGPAGAHRARRTDRHHQTLASVRV